MKKIILVATVMLFACSSLSFAAASKAPTAADDGQTVYGVDTGTATANDTLIAKLSTGVYLGWLTGVNGYTLYTQHKNGTRTYGTSYDSTALYRNDTIQTAAPTSSLTATAFGSGWTEL